MFKLEDKVRVLQDKSFYGRDIDTKKPHIIWSIEPFGYFVYPEDARNLKKEAVFVTEIEHWRIVDNIALDAMKIMEYMNKEYVPRDSKRIPEIMHAISVLWSKYPDLRFGQLIKNIHYSSKYKNIDIFYLEDDKWLEIIKEFNNKFTTGE